MTASDTPAGAESVAAAEAVAVVMAAMGCKVEEDYPGCRPRADGYCGGHGVTHYCTEHDWFEDGNTSLVCGYAAMISGRLAAANLLADPAATEAAAAQARREALDEVLRRIEADPEDSCPYRIGPMGIPTPGDVTDQNNAMDRGIGWAADQVRAVRDTAGDPS